MVVSGKSVVSGTFNREAFDASDAGLTGSAEKADREFNPFAPNTHVSPVNAVKLAALEDGAGSGMIRRVTTGERGRESKERRAAREYEALRHALAQQWDAQIVSVGGVSMTNAQAQAARRRILDDPEYYTRWAKERGLIKEGEEKEFIDTAREITELKDLERSGELSAEQSEKLKRLQGSRVGRAVDQATGQAHLGRELGLAVTSDQRAYAAEGSMAAAPDDALAARMTAEKSQQPQEALGVCPVGDPVFANAPSLKSGFAAGLKATEPLDRARTNSAGNPAPPCASDRKASASGLDL